MPRIHFTDADQHVGPLLGVLVTAAGGQDSVAGQTLIGRVAAEHPTIGKTWVGGYRQHLVEHALAPTLALTLA
ncbi:hypothetical protein OG220_39140 [Streptomyces sp. NBC_01187]|nr:hypothetical protein OG220_39140 [Streptomyces sp. NBC_01187]